MQRSYSVVIIGGGTGSFAVLSGLKLFHNLSISAIVAMSDDGGSTGKLRDELGVLPPGDARQCLVALSESPNVMRQLFTYRFESGNLAGHNVGNLLLSALEKITGSFEESLHTASEILATRGEVIPVTTNNVHIHTTLSDGTIIVGEDALGNTHLGDTKITSIELKPEASLTPRAKEAIKNADAIIIGPGKVYCSLLPALIVPDLIPAIRESNATVIYNVNLMSSHEHHSHWSVEDFVHEMQSYLGKDTIDYALYNTHVPNPSLIHKYEHEGTVTKKVNQDATMGKTQLLGADLLAEELFQNPNKTDLLVRTLIRHDPFKIAQALYPLITGEIEHASAHSHPTLACESEETRE